MTTFSRSLLGLLFVAVAACGGNQEPATSTSSAFLGGAEDQLYTDGMRAWRDGDTAGAEARFRGALEANPRYLAAHIALGGLLLDTDQPDEALRPFEDAIALRNTSIDAHLGRARALAATGRLVEASDAAQSAVSLSHNAGNRELEADTHAVLGAIHEESGRIDDAIASFERALELDAGTTEARVGLAHLYRAANRMPDAVRVLSRAAQYETNPNLLLTVGRAFHDFGVYDRAIEALEIAHDAAPANEEVLYYYASSAVRSGRNDLGIQLASDLIGRAPDYLPAYVVRGEANLERGYIDNARADAGAVLAAEPNNYDALILAGDIAATGGDAATAESRYRQAMTERPDHLRAIEHLARFYDAERRYDDFVALVEPQIGRSDRPEGWLGMLIDAMLRTGLEAESVPYQSELATQRESDHMLNFEVADRALRHAGSLPPETILAHARRAVEHIGGAPLPYRLALIDALVLNGRESEARDVIDRAEDLFPNASELAERRRRLR